MGLFDKHLAYRDAYKAIQDVGANPFKVRFDAVHSPTEGVVEYLWPDKRWARTFDDPDGSVDVILEGR